MDIFLLLFDLVCINYNNCTCYLHHKHSADGGTAAMSSFALFEYAVTQNIQNLPWPERGSECVSWK